MNEYVVSKDNEGIRLDRFVIDIIKKTNKDITRSQIEEYVKKYVLVNSEVEGKGYKLRVGDSVSINEEGIVKGVASNDFLDDIKPVHGNLSILEETSDYIIINKEKGVAVHPSLGNIDNTIANYVKYYLQSKGEYSEAVLRAGIVHRLDKGVGGLLIVAKTREYQIYLQKQFENHTVDKVYLAELIEVTSPIPESSREEGEEVEKLIDRKFEVNDLWVKVGGYIKRDIINPLKMVVGKSGKEVLSYILPLKDHKALIIIKTGRTHQIRATVESLGWAIKGDVVYGDANGSNILELDHIVMSLNVSDSDRKAWKLI